MQKGRQKRRNYGEKIHEMHLVLWVFVVNFGGGGFKKSWGRERNAGWDLGPQSSALAQSVLSLCLHYLASLEAPNPNSHRDPRVHFHSPISWYKDPCLASTWGGFRGAGVSMFIISSQHCFHWPAGRALIGVGRGRTVRGPGYSLPCYIPFHTFLE